MIDNRLFISRDERLPLERSRRRGDYITIDPPRLVSRDILAGEEIM